MLDDAISDEELRARLFAAVSREELVACLDKIGEWVTGKRSDLFHGIVRRHAGLLQLAVFFFRAIKYWSGFAGVFCSVTSKCSAKDLLYINFYIA
jgi:hypothetical protein